MDLFEIVLVLAMVAFFASAAMLVAMATSIAWHHVRERRQRRAHAAAARPERRIRGGR